MIAPLAEAMSGKYWWPTVTESSVAAGPGQLRPSGELRTWIFAWPAAFSALQTTWTPFSSAATADRLAKREYVRPVAQAKGPSPQSDPPNWSESNGVIRAMSCGSLQLTPPSVDFVSQTASNVDGWCEIVRNVT